MDNDGEVPPVANAVAPDPVVRDDHVDGVHKGGYVHKPLHAAPDHRTVGLEDEGHYKGSMRETC